MRTINDFSQRGLFLKNTFLLERGAPHGNGRTVKHPSVGPYESFDDSRIRLNGAKNFTLSDEDRNRLRGEIESGAADHLLTAEDYQKPLWMRKYEVGQGPVSYGGPGGYRHQPKTYKQIGSRSLDEMVREMSGHPKAEWAIRPMVKAYPEQQGPELLIFEPIGDIQFLQAGAELQDNDIDLQEFEDGIMVGEQFLPTMD